MAKYLLDANILAILEAQDHPFHTAVFTRFSRLQDHDEVYLSILTLYEYEYSIAEAKTELAVSLRAIQQTLLDTFTFLPLTESGAVRYGQIKSAYKKQTGIHKNAIKRHNLDFMLASTPLAAGVILVSGDRIFEQIRVAEPDFQWEDWTCS